MQVAKPRVVRDAIYVKTPSQTQYILYRFVYQYRNGNVYVF